SRRDQDAGAGQPRQMLRGQHGNGAEGDGEKAAEQQPGTAEAGGVAGGIAEQQQPQPENGIDAHLAENGQDGRHGRAGGGIGVGQPEAQRPHRGLDQEGDTEDGGAGLQQGAILGGNGGDAGSE